MSIWASLDAPCEDHEDSCAQWDKHDGYWEISDRPCDCGLPKAPLVYHGSHILPEQDGERGGDIDIALLRQFVRHYRDHPDSDEEPEGVEPFLRFGVNSETVVLDVNNVRLIHETLTWWLAEVEKGLA